MLMSKMFGFSGMNNNKQYEFFSWKNFKQSELILRVLPNYFSDHIYKKVYTHQIQGRYYIHPIQGECNLCEVLNSNDKYSEIQNKILKIKVENKKEKWEHVINNHMYVMLFAIIKGYSKIQILRFYDVVGESLMNIILGKDIKDNISDLKEGNSIKIIFDKLDYFPYIKVNDIVIGKKKPIFNSEEKIEKIDNILHSDEFNLGNNITSLDDAQEIIDTWYDKATKFYNLNTHTGNGEIIFNEEYKKHDDDSFDFDDKDNTDDNIIESDDIKEDDPDEIPF